MASIKFQDGDAGNLISAKTDRQITNSDLVGHPGRCKSRVWKYFGFRLSAEEEIDMSVAICRLCHAATKYNGNTTNMASHLAKRHNLNVICSQQLGSYGTQYGSPQEVMITDDSGSSDSVIGCGSTEQKAVEASQSKPVERHERPENDVNCTVTTTSRKRPSLSSTADEPQERSICAKVLPKLTPRPNVCNSKEFLLAPSLATFLIADSLPLSIISGEGFRYFLKTVEPQYASKVKDLGLEVKNLMFKERFESVKKNIKRELSLANSNVALTLETWKACSGDSYVTASAVFLSESWIRKTFVLETRKLKQAMTNDDWKQLVLDLAETWNIVNPLVVASDIPAFVQCFGNALQKVVQRCFQVSPIRELVKRVRELGHCFMDLRSLRMQNQPRGLLESNSITVDHADNWTSTYDMLLEVVTKHDSISSVLMEDVEVKDQKNMFLSIEEQEDIDNLLEVLRPLKTAVQAMLEQESPSASIILPVVSQLKKSLEVNTLDSALAHTARCALMEELESFYQDAASEETLILCTTLDPRFKDLTFLQESGRARALHSIVETSAKRQRKTALSAVSEAAIDSCATKQSRLDSDGKPNTSAMSLLFQDMLPERSAARDDTSEMVLNELNRYQKAEQTIALNDDICQWWMIRAGIYPQLSTIAKLYIALPATAVPPVRIFTDAGRKEIEKRSHLESEFMDKMIFLHSNNKYC